MLSAYFFVGGDTFVLVLEILLKRNLTAIPQHDRISTGLHENVAEGPW